MIIKDNYLARMLSLRWAPELSAYDAMYKIAATLIRKSNSFSAIIYTKDYSRIDKIVPLTVDSFRIFEDDNGNILFRFVWDYDKKMYTLPYQNVIHIRARFSKSRFVGTPPDAQIKTTLDLIETTGESLKNIVKSSANLKGYLKYNNFIDDTELKKKTQEFATAYMTASNEGGIAGIGSEYEFHEITQRTPVIPTVQSQYLRENLYRYYGVNEDILQSKLTDASWNSFYENVIEPIALQLSLEFTYKVLTDRERGFGNKIIFTADRLQYATMTERCSFGAMLFDREIITVNDFREIMYYPPVGDGDVRMVSLNYVKSTDQSLYQTGQNSDEKDEPEDPEEPDDPEETGKGGQQNKKTADYMRMYVRSR